MRGLTFDMRGGRQLAKPDVARPLDGRVRPRFGLARGNHPSFDKRPDGEWTLILNGLFGSLLHALPSLPMLDSLKDSDVLAPFGSAAFVSDRELRLSARAFCSTRFCEVGECAPASGGRAHETAADGKHRPWVADRVSLAARAVRCEA